jgi:hypothetical protein
MGNYQQIGKKQYRKNISLKNNVVNILRINHVAHKNGLCKLEIELLKSQLKNSKLLSFRKINNVVKINKIYHKSLVDMFTKSLGLELSQVINSDKPEGILYYMDFVKK